MIEVAATIQEVGERIDHITGSGVTVIGPALDGGWGITTRHNGFLVHLGISNIHLSPGKTALEANGRLYLAPKPENEQRPLSEVAIEGLPDNCGVFSLPEHYRVSRDPFGREQAEWLVTVAISGPGTTPYAWSGNTFLIRAAKPVTGNFNFDTFR